MPSVIDIDELRDARAFLDYLHWEQENTPLEHVQAALNWLFLHVGAARLAEVRSVEHHPFNQPKRLRDQGKVPNPYLYLCEVMQSMDLSARPTGCVTTMGDLFVNFRHPGKAPSAVGKGRFYVHIGRLFGGNALTRPESNKGLGISSRQSEQHLYLATRPPAHYLRSTVADAFAFPSPDSAVESFHWANVRNLDAPALRRFNDAFGRDFKSDYWPGRRTQCYFADPSPLRLL